MNLRAKLDEHYLAFDKSKISPDPLQFLHLFKSEKDIESIGFIASVFAYGNVSQIINSVNKILAITNNQPFDFIMDFNPKELDSIFKNVKHRFYTESDIRLFFRLLKSVYSEYDSLKNLFSTFTNPQDVNVKNPINKFSEYFITLARKTNPNMDLTPGLKFMFPLPDNGSACKRINLFLRWMVRHDELDFGIWSDIVKPNKLIIPVDTHVARVCRSIRLTNRKNVSWLMAEEITLNLSKFDPSDPVKYDFAICHIGMRKLKF